MMVIEGLSFWTGHITQAQLTVAVVFPSLLLASLFTPVRLIIAIFFLVALGLACVAIAQAPFRGTHRWCLLGDWRINVSVPLVVATVLSISAARSVRIKLLFTALSTLILVATASYSSALLLVAVVCCCSSPTAGRQQAVRLAAFILMAMVVATIVATPNRLRRLHQHAQGSGYQTTQVRNVLGQLRIVGPSRGAYLHLPARKTDFALLDIMAHCGVSAGIAVLGSYVAIFLFLKQISCGLPNPADEIIAASAATVALVVFFHLLVNLSLLPPFGVPAPSLGAGLSADLSYKTLICVCVAAQYQAQAACYVARPVTNSYASADPALMPPSGGG